MYCNGWCDFCEMGCFIGEVKGNQEKISPIQKSDFQEDVVPLEEPEKPETGLAVIEVPEVYEVKKGLFGKEKVVRTQ